MIQIVLNDEQAKIVASAHKPVQVCDGSGNLLGIIAPTWTEADIADAHQRLASKEPRYTTAQVLEHLRALESK
jgi:hypothetical protein